MAEPDLPTNVVAAVGETPPRRRQPVLGLDLEAGAATRRARGHDASAVTEAFPL